MLKRNLFIKLMMGVLLTAGLAVLSGIIFTSEVRAAAEPDNLAFGKPYIASSEDKINGTTYYPGYMALDGSTGSSWTTSDTGYMSSPVCDQWLMVDLGSSFSIKRWVVRHSGGWGGDVYITNDFKLEYSRGNENGPWYVAGNPVSDNTNAVTDITLAEPVTARYVRLHITQKSRTGSAYPAVRIVEFEVYSDTAAKVTASVPSGSVKEGTQVSLSSPTSDAVIYYTTDNSDPKSSMTRAVYSTPLTLNSTTTIKTYAKKVGLIDSGVSEFNYQVVRIVASPQPGAVALNTHVTLSTPISGGSIYYTLDGTDPTSSASAILYTSYINIAKDTLIRANTLVGSTKSAALNLSYSLTKSTTNVALNKTATTSSQKVDHPAGNAVDSSESTQWMANNYDNGNWLKIDLGANYDLTGAKIVWYESGKRYKYKIETSTDGLRWWEAVNKTANITVSQTDELTFTDSLRRYIRITVTGLDSGARPSIKDFQVYGYASNTVPAVPVGPNTSGFPRPIIVPLPQSVAGVNNPVISLKGTWKFTTEPSQAFWKNSTDTAAWTDIAVPGDLVVQGVDKNILDFNNEGNRPSKNREFFYKKLIYIPGDYAGRDILIRFESTYNYARLWVDGQQVRTHIGGFSTWDTDITNYVTAGQYVWITVGLTDEVQSLNFPIARGILGDVKLIALPSNHVIRLHTETDMNGTYTNATLKVTAGMDFDNASNATVQLTLKNPSGGTVSISPSSISLSSGVREQMVSISVTAPLKWDAEHPNLYTLQADVVVSGTTVQTVIRKVGFREVEIIGKQMFVNGDPIKLRGVNYVNSYALRGIYVPDPVYDRESLVKLKEANVNFIRTTHMPMHEFIYDILDELGMYVEEEVSNGFVGAWHQSVVQSLDDPNYVDEYVGQMAEMIEKNRSHASIIYRSYGNESNWGINMGLIHDYAKLEDPLRPLKFSWGFSVPEGYYDIFSLHYPSHTYDFGTKAIPEIYDEYAHLYTRLLPEDQYRFDLSYRDFYGENIKKYWENMYAPPGVLGGAIWNAMDFAYFPPGGPGTIGGTWGLLDSWNREKPEYWNVKKAYSPIRIDEEALPNPGTGNPLSIPIKNWYNHTNLNELQIHWAVGVANGTITNLNIPHGSSGNLVIPARSWAYGDEVELEFYQGAMLVDTFKLSIGELKISYPAVAGPHPTVTNNVADITVTGSNFNIVFSKEDGMITNGYYRTDTIITGGPYLNLGNYWLGDELGEEPGDELRPWTLDSISGSTNSNQAIIHITGSYENGAVDIDVDFVVKIDAAGLITTTYTIDNPPIYDHPGDADYYNEVGVAYNITSNVDRISWKKDGIWSVYPDDHIGRLDGVAYKVKSSGTETYGVEPEWPWAEDEKDFFAYQIDDPGDRGTNDFRGSKKDYYYASLILEGSNLRVRAEGDGTGSVRASINEVDGSIRYNINNLWGHFGGLGSTVRKLISISSGYTNTVNMRLTDNHTVTAQYLPSAFLKGMTVTDGELNTEFRKSTYAYFMNVDKEIDSITVTPVSVDPGAVITVNEVANSSGVASSPIHLKAGTNTITILVTAVGGVITQEYTITVTRASTATDLVLNKAYSASSAEVYTAKNALDDSTVSFWATKDTGYHSSTASNEWLMVDLGQSYNIDRWLVLHTDYDSGVYITRDFRLEYSIGDSEGPWMSADSVVGNTAATTDRILQAPINARYVRLYITKKSQDGSAYPAVRIAEFKVFPRARNIAEQKSYTASSEDLINSQYWPGSRALDGDLNTFWSTHDTGYHSSVVCDEWLRVDLGQSTYIGSWFVRHIGNGWESGAHNTQDFQLEYSTNDSSGPWVVADSVVGNTNEITDRTLSNPVKARYVRLHITKDAANGASYPAVRINEFKLYSVDLFNDSGDLAMNKPASADSFINQSVSVDKAFDGRVNTRWSSLANSTYPHWLKVDLGASYPVNQVKLEWENAYAVNYKIQVSSDDSTWTDAVTITGNSTKSLTHNFATANARYVRVYVTSSSQGASTVSLWSFRVYSHTDLAYGKTASADSIKAADVSADKAVDGNKDTPWTSLANSTYPHWLKVDLGASYSIDRVQLSWEPAYATNYKVQISTDNSTWTDAVTVTGNSSRSQTHSFTAANARYVRIYVTGSSQAASNVSLDSVIVYAPQ